MTVSYNNMLIVDERKNEVTIIIIITVDAKFEITLVQKQLLLT